MFAIGSSVKAIKIFYRKFLYTFLKNIFEEPPALKRFGILHHSRMLYVSSKQIRQTLKRFLNGIVNINAA
jgi:hypothetical protein